MTSHDIFYLSKETEQKVLRKHAEKRQPLPDSHGWPGQFVRRMCKKKPMPFSEQVFKMLLADVRRKKYKQLKRDLEEIEQRHLQVA